MLRLIFAATVIATCGIVLTAILGVVGRAPTPVPPQPTIEQVQQLAELVVLRVALKDIHTTRLDGYMGGIDLVLLVHGQIEVGCDLKSARFETIDDQLKQVVVSISKPTASRPALDHTRTAVYQIRRTGVWGLVPGGTGETRLVNRAMSRAQEVLTGTVNTTDLTTRARQQASKVLAQFFSSVGWSVQIVWRDDTQKGIDQ